MFVVVQLIARFYKQYQKAMNVLTKVLRLIQDVNLQGACGARDGSPIRYVLRCIGRVPRPLRLTITYKSRRQASSILELTTISWTKWSSYESRSKVLSCCPHGRSRGGDASPTYHIEVIPPSTSIGVPVIYRDSSDAI